MTQKGILDGLRIVEGSAFIAAPMGGMTLAQMGADVIRFDPIGGGIDYNRWPVTRDGKSLYWPGLNKHKRSIQVDIRRPEGREIVKRLINAPGPDAGIFLTNFPPEGWLAYDAIKAGRDDLIMVNIVGNPDGSTALDYSVNSALGFPFATGPANWSGPVNHVLPAWDCLCALTAANAILAAERHRARSGAGQYVRISLADIGLAITGMLGFIAEIQVNGQERPMSGNDVYGAFGRDFKTGDGRHVMVAAISGGQWKALGKATEMTEKFAQIEAMMGLDFAKEADRYEGRRMIGALLEPWFEARTLDQVRAVFDANRVLWGPYQSFTELVQHDWRCSPQNPMFQEVEQPGIGPYLVPASPIQFAEPGRLPPAPAPVLGQHTDAILADVLGMGSAEIGKLHDAGIVAGPDKS